MHKNKTDEMEHFRAYLGLLGRLQLNNQLAGMVDVSGVVQMTMHEACQQAAAQLRQESI